jgi:phage terminase Nu1 subunit (DNA packaging protein)
VSADEADRTAKRLLVNQRELAKILGCTAPTVREMIARYPDLPIDTVGAVGREYLFDAAAVTEFLATKRDEEAAASAERQELFDQFRLPLPDDGANGVGAISPSQRVAIAKAIALERRNAIETGQLILASEMRQTLTVAIAALAQHLNGLPQQIGRQFNLNEAVVRGIQLAINDGRRTFVRTLRKDLDITDRGEAAGGVASTATAAAPPSEDRLPWPSALAGDGRDGL